MVGSTSARVEAKRGGSAGPPCRRARRVVRGLLNPDPPHYDIISCRASRLLRASETMEQPFEFMFGAAGRINRAKYWKSMLIFCIARLFAGVILMTAAGLAAPLFIIALVVILPSWLIWGFSIHTERLHDRGGRPPGKKSPKHRTTSNYPNQLAPIQRIWPSPRNILSIPLLGLE